MLPRYRFTLAIFALTAGFLSAPFTAPANAIDENCRQVLSAPTNGVDAINKLGMDFTYVATLNNRTTKELENLLKESKEFFIDQCGHGYFADTTNVARELPLPGALDILPTSLVTGIGMRPVINADQVFKLHSNPSSKKIIYLNFKGKKISGTAWNVNYNNNAEWVAKGFSQDADFGNFTKTELEIIQSVWQRVAEDFVAFEIDVTTEQPSADALDRTNAADKEYGTEMLISADPVIFNACKCSGLAYLSSFDMIGTEHAANQPGWVFTLGVGDNPKYIAEAVTHEAGHTLGLSHDGTTSSAYFAGNNGWAPIMGVGFYQPVTQWSKGEYPSANNLEDEYKVMASHGVDLRPDEDKNSFDTARSLKFGQKIGGIIDSPADQDYFVFTVPNSGEFTVNALPATFSPNLDIDLTIYEGTTNKILYANPPLKVVNNDIADGLSASVTGKFASNKKYYVVIAGTPISTDAKTTKYGSIGTYQVSLDSKSVMQLSVLPNAGSQSGAGQSSQFTDITLQLVSAVATDDPQKLILPNGVKVYLDSKVKRLILRTGDWLL